MRSPSRFALALAGSALLAGCGAKKAPEQPAPEPAPTQPAPAPAPPPVQAAPSGPSAEDAAAAAARESASLLAEVKAMVHFEFDQAEIRAEDRSILDRKAQILGANAALRLTVSGHADERGSDEYNLALGNRRAAAAKTYLVNKGIDATRLAVSSYGEERPLDSGHDENAWAQNRRAEFDATAGASNLHTP